MKTSIIIIILTMISIFNINAEEYEPSFGFGASINTSQAAVYIPILIGEKNIIAPSFSFNSNSNFILAGVGLEYKRYLSEMYSTRSYFSGGAGYSTSIQNKKANAPNFSVGVGYGLEYFVDKNFSVGAEATLNGRFGNTTIFDPYFGSYSVKDKVFGFGMVLYATIYI